MTDSFSERLCNLIKSTGMTNRQVSEATDISYISISHYINDKGKPGIDNLIKLADFFGVPMDYLIGRCTEEQAKKIYEDYSSTFMVLRRAPYEAYLSGRNKIKTNSKKAEGQWPYNLMERIFGEPCKDVVSDEQMEGIDTALGELPERHKNSLLLYFRDGMTMREIADEYGVGGQRVQQIINKALKNLQAEHRKNLIRFGKDGAKKKGHIAQLRQELEKEAAYINRMKQQIDLDKAKISDIIMWDRCEMKIEEMNLSNRTSNLLHREGYITLGDVLKVIESGKLMKIKKMGKKTADEVLTRVYEITNIQYTPDGKRA